MKFNIKEKYTNFKSTIKKLIEKYPLTLISIYLLTFFYAILMETDLWEEEWILKIFAFIAIWIPGTFFSENIFGKDKKRIFSYIATAIISIVFVQWEVFCKDEDIIIKLLLCYISTLVAGSSFTIIKKSEKSFSEYILKVSINFVKVSFVYGILALGVAAVLWIFDVLIWDVTSQYIDNIEILILGFFYSTEIIYSLINLEEDVNKFFKNLVKYVLMPLLIIAFTIIYLYIIKILILRDIPKNQIFRIATALFIVGGFIWTVMGYFKEEGTIYKISTKLPIVFSPFIILQIYTMGVRIEKNGVTPLRYAGFVFIIFEVCYIICYIVKKEKIKNLILLADIFLIIAVLVPKVNAFDISDSSQIKNLKLYMQKNELTEEDKSKISGAYDYLKYTDNGKVYIEKNLSKEQINKIEELKTSTTNNSYRNDYKYFYLKNDNKLNIVGYSSLSKVNASSYSNEKIEKVFSKVKFKSNDENNFFTVDLTEKINEYINIYAENGEEFLNEYFRKNNEIQINQNQKLIFNNFTFSYYYNKEEISSFSIEAYLLEK